MSETRGRAVKRAEFPSGPVRTLLVEDNAADVRLFREFLAEASGRQRFALDHAASLQDARRHLGLHATDVVFLDLGLPDAQGLASYTALRDAYPDLPVVVLTGADDEDLAIEALKAGAQDYLVKGEVSGNQLARAARHAVERKRAEEALRLSESRLREISRLARIGYWSLDLEQDKVDWSPEVYELFGIDPGTFQANRAALEKLVHPDDREAVARSYSASIADHTPYDVAHRILAADGGVRYVRVRGLTTYDERGRALRTVGSFQDVTADREAELQLRKLSEAVDQTSASIVITDREGNIEYVNRAFTSVTGYATSEAIGQNPRLLKSGVTPRETYLELWEQVAAGKTWEGDLCNRKKNGDLFWEHAVISPVKDAAGHTVSFIASKIDITERRRAEEALRESSERIELLLGSAAEAIVGVDQQGICTFANPACARLLGCESADTLVGRDVHSVLHGGRAEGAPHSLDECPVRRSSAAGSAVHVLDEVFWRLDGTSVNVEYWSHPIEQGGRTLGAVITFLDTTERVKAETALRAAQQTLRHVVSSSPAVLHSLRVEGRAFVPTWVSENIEDLLGFPPSQVLAPAWWLGQLHPDDRDRAFQEQELLFTDGQLTTEYRVADARGSYHWIRSELRMLRDAGGRAVEAIGSWSEVSARKEIEQRLRQSEEQYRLLFDQSPHPMAVIDADTTAIRAVNEATVRHYGYSRDELLAMTLREVRAPEAVAGLAEDYDLAPTGDGDPPGPLQTRHRKKDGSVIDVEISRSRIVFEDRPAWLTLMADVTERKTLQAQLAQSQKMESMGQLAGGVAHDFNNLLGVITGYQELLQRKLGPNPALERYVAEIGKAAQRASGLTRQLLAFSRKQMLQPRVLDLNLTIADTEKMLRRLIGEDVELTTKFGSQLGQVKADPGQVEQILMNLAVNGRDAMPRGGSLLIETANVVVEAKSSDSGPQPPEPGRYVALIVSDSGTGMTPEVQARIFEPFFTTKETGKGTGLGLATVHGFVVQSGGHISVRSELGQGTAFTILLPRVDLAESDLGEDPHDPTALPRGTETLLLVEDEPSLRQILHETLEEAGYTVRDAVDGRDALRVFSSEGSDADLLITDVVMPGMGGRELAETLSALRPDLKVLYMSGYTDDAVIRHGLHAESTEFVQKPFTAQMLARRVREVLDQRAAASLAVGQPR